MSPSRPDPEKLAAFVDGRLSSADRDEVVRALASSPEDLSALLLARDALADVERESPELLGGPASRPSERYRRWVLPSGLAAAAVIVLAVSLVQRVGKREAGVLDPALALSLHSPPADWASPAWGRTRSAAESAGIRTLALRIGARLTDFELAARAREASATELARDVVSLAANIPGSSTIGTTCTVESLGSQLGAAQEPVSRRQSCAKALSVLAGEDLVAAGAWLEATRIAADRRDAAYLASRTWSDGLAHARRALPEPSAAAHLRVLESAPAQPALDWDAIRAATEALLRSRF